MVESRHPVVAYPVPAARLQRPIEAVSVLDMVILPFPDPQATALLHLSVLRER